MQRWIVGARPRTLPAAVVPVAIGASAAVGAGAVVWWRVVAALVVSLSLQIGVNYANDYSDGIRGTDDVRVGPVRLVASGLASPAAVKRAALLAFGFAAIAGLAIALDTSLWLLVVGAAAIAAGWCYTGGPRPYGYLGLGEVFVFVFFGLVATSGTTYAAITEVTALSIVMGCAAGALACALLVVNNVRDIPTDRDVGKRTLAVRFGDRRARQFYVVLIVSAFLLGLIGAAWRPPLVLVLLAVPLAFRPARDIVSGAEGRELVAVLGATGMLQLGFGVLASVGLVFGS